MCHAFGKSKWKFRVILYEVLGEEEMATNTKRFLMLPRQQSKEVGQMTLRSTNWLVVTLMTSAMAVLSSHPALAQQTVGAPPGRGSYIRNCGACHGDDAKGDGAYNAELKVKPADLTQLAKKSNGTFPSARVERILDGSDAIPGHGSRQSPVWGHEFGAGSAAAG